MSAKTATYKGNDKSISPNFRQFFLQTYTWMSWSDQKEEKLTSCVDEIARTFMFKIVEVTVLIFWR